jgi:DNA mismatch endonuclease (patch repair protein)
MSRRTIDIAFVRKKVAVFVDGCFWHSCPDHGTRPKADALWWMEKLQRNVDRDRETDEFLILQGWTVVRVWEHLDVADAMELVESRLHGRQGTT